jgi:hypothetical protein
VKVALLAFVGLFLGAIAGAVVGAVVGLAWTKVFETSGFEGYSGMLVFSTFMPIGALLGAAPSGSAPSARATAPHRRDEGSGGAALVVPE